MLVVVVINFVTAEIVLFNRQNLLTFLDNSHSTLPKTYSECLLDTTITLVALQQHTWPKK